MVLLLVVVCLGPLWQLCWHLLLVLRLQQPALQLLQQAPSWQLLQAQWPQPVSH